MAPACDLTIRTLRSSDVDAVYQFSEDLGLSRWSRSDLFEELGHSESCMLLAELEQQPVGFIIGRKIPGNDEGSFDAEIYNIGVVTQCQKRGTGGELIDRFLKWAKANKVVNVWLEVRAANLSAVRFYRRHGFEEVVTRKGFYSDPVDDAIVMRAEISEYYNDLNKESLK